MSRKALVVWGGWDGHQPKQVAEIYRSMLEPEGFSVEISDSVNSFADRAKLMSLHLILPHWTMGKITREQCDPVLEAVQSGVGIAGCHGGLCDAFRESAEWQFMTGGQFVAHPGNDGTTYKIKIGPVKSSITEGINDFEVSSEQYYMHVDPAVKVLATSRFPTVEGPHSPNGPVDMPAIWTKLYGKGRVFYNQLGHLANVVSAEPNYTIMKRGLLWAAKA